MMQTIQRYFLYPFNFVYACILFLRNLFFDIKIFQSKKLSVPVISVGNITTGGTGKTPAVAYVANLLQSRDYKVGILSRGYKRSSRGYLVISDGANIRENADRGGDEPVMLAHKIPGAFVAVHEKRYPGGKSMIQNYRVDVIVLDDGFQHRALHRDLDIVLIDASSPEHLRAHIPVGRLRESLRSLRRADIVIATKYSNDLMLKSIEQLVHRYTPAPVIGSEIKLEDFFDVMQEESVPVQNVVPKTAYLFSGIAQPEEFHRTVHDAGISIAGFHRFPDHHRFTENDIHTVLDEAKHYNADVLLTTEKDAIRLQPYKHLFNEALPLYAVRISFSIANDDGSVLEKFIRRTMNKHKTIKYN